MSENPRIRRYFYLPVPHYFTFTSTILFTDPAFSGSGFHRLHRSHRVLHHGSDSVSVLLVPFINQNPVLKFKTQKQVQIRIRHINNLVKTHKLSTKNYSKKTFYHFRFKEKLLNQTEQGKNRIKRQNSNSCYVQSCSQTITGRNMRYARALQVNLKQFF